MQKQTHKYILSMLIATILLLSMLPAVPVQAAITALTTPAADQPVEVGEEVWVNGTAGVGELVKVYWETETPDNLLGEEYAVGGDFSILITIPPALAGYHYILLRPTGVIENRRLVLTPKVTLTPDTGLAGDTISVAGSGFGEEKVVTLRLWNATGVPKPWNMKLSTTPAEVKTGTKGSFTCTFKIPSNATTYGWFNVEARDTVPNVDTVTLIVGATVTLSLVEGPSGTKVAVTGRGFTKTAGKAVDLSFTNDTVLFAAPEVADITTRSDGTFSGDIVVPTLDVDEYKVWAKDEMGISSGGVDFEVTGKTSVILDPKSAPPDSVVAIEGVNFTAILNTDVTVKFWTGTTTVTITKTFKTNATGGFKGTFTIPVDPRLPIRTAPYTVNVTDANDLFAYFTFRVVRTIAALYPDEGPTGTEVEVWASGLTTGAEYNITIGGVLMVDGMATGTLTGDELPANT
ncbi:MAG: hypothetical protein OEX00_10535, partial [Gammaproteobacteria bacterium]|nr:hypothetical protein [Gammaproteobacteria bacterium]